MPAVRLIQHSDLRVGLRVAVVAVAPNIMPPEKRTVGPNEICGELVPRVRGNGTGVLVESGVPHRVVWDDNSAPIEFSPVSLPRVSNNLVLYVEYEPTWQDRIAEAVAGSLTPVRAAPHLRALALEGLNVLASYVQDQLGADSGDVAAQYIDGDSRCVAAITEYVGAEFWDQVARANEQCTREPAEPVAAEEPAPVAAIPAFILRALELSTFHMPCGTLGFPPDWTASGTEDGAVVILKDAHDGTAPPWMRPILALARQYQCTTITFSADAPEIDSLPILFRRNVRAAERETLWPVLINWLGTVGLNPAHFAKFIDWHSGTSPARDTIRLYAIRPEFKRLVLVTQEHIDYLATAAAKVSADIAVENADDGTIYITCKV